MSISNLSSSAVEYAPPRVVALDRPTTQSNKPAETQAEPASRPVNRPDANESVRAAQATEQARNVASQNAQVLRFDADKQLEEQQDAAKQGANQQAKEPKQEQLQQALEVTNQLSSIQARKLEFTSSKEDGRTVIKVVDRQNDEVIRQIPSEEFVKLATRISDLTEKLSSAQGLLFESKV